MVSANRVKKKLPSLLINGETTDKKQWAAGHRIENGLKRLKKRSPKKYNSLEARLIRNLDAMAKAALER